MEAIKRTKIVDVLKSEAFGTTVNVKGWVRTRRGSKQVSFITYICVVDEKIRYLD